MGGCRDAAQQQECGPFAELCANRGHLGALLNESAYVAEEGIRGEEGTPWAKFDSLEELVVIATLHEAGDVVDSVCHSPPLRTFFVYSQVAGRSSGAVAKMESTTLPVASLLNEGKARSPSLDVTRRGHLVR